MCPVYFPGCGAATKSVQQSREGKSQSSQSSAAKKNAALLLILPATQASPYVRREIVEMQKWCSHGNLISHLSSPNHNCVYLNWDSKSVMNCWFLKEKTRHLRHLLQNLRGLHTSKLLLLLWKASLHEIYSHENVDILVWIAMHCGKTFTPPLLKVCWTF